MISDFNIHNVFQFRVVGENRKLFKFVENEFSFFKVRRIRRPDLILRIGKFIPKIRGCTVINNKYYVKENYLFCRDSYKIVKWEVQFHGLDKERTIVDFNGNYFAASFLVQYIIEPLIRLKTIQKGFIFLHSSSISDGSNAAIFPASKGIGKTSTILNFLRNGGIYLSDDFVIISKDKRVLSYPTTIHLFDYNIKHCPFVWNNLSLKRKVELKLKNLIYKLTLGYAQFPVYISLLETFPHAKIQDSCRLKLVVFLKKVKGEKLRLKKIKNLKKLIEGLIHLNKFEDFHFSEYARAYSCIFPGSKIAKRWLYLRKNLFLAFQNVLCYELTVPEYTPQIFKILKKLLVQNGFKFISQS